MRPPADEEAEEEEEEEKGSRHRGTSTSNMRQSPETRRANQNWQTL